MNRRAARAGKHAGRVVVLAAVAAALLGALWLARLSDGVPADAGAPLLPLLGESAGGLSVVRITLPGDRVLVTLEQRGSEWVAAEYDDWPADTERLRDLALALAQARRVERMTSNPDAWHRLGLQEISDPDADGVAVTLQYNGTHDVLIVGRTGVIDGEHSYVRRLDEPTAWTVNRNLAVPRSAADWLHRGLTDVPATRIRQVSIVHADGERLDLTHDGGGRFELQDLPEGARLLHDAVADGVGGVLAALHFDALHTATEPPPEAATRAEVLTDDGLRITVHAWRDGPRRLAELEAAVDANGVETWLRRTQPPDPDAPSDDGPPAPPALDTPVAPQRLQQALDERQTEVDALNRRLVGRHFELPGHRHAQLTRRLQDLLAD